MSRSDISPSRRMELDEGPNDDFLDLPLDPAADNTEPAWDAPTPPTRRVAAPQPPEPRRRWLGWVLLLVLLPLAVAAGYFLNLDPAVLVPSVELVDFGEVRLGGDVAVAELKLENRGEKLLRISTLELEGEGASAFGLLENQCQGREVAPGESCALKLTFVPPGRGTAKAQLGLSSDAVNGEQRLPLIGVAVAPRLEVERAELDFETLPMGAASGEQTLRIANRGNAPLSLRGLRFEGLASADFFRASDDCSATPLPPSGRCSLSFFFVPSKEGLREASLFLDSDAPEAAPTVRLLGRGLVQEPLLAVDTAMSQFEPRRVGSASPPESLTISNDGTGVLLVERVTVVPEDAGFSVSEEGCTEEPVAPEGSCSIAVVFKPSSLGESRAVLEIVHDAGDEPHRVPLLGAGTAPRARIEPSRLSFGETAQGAVSRARSVTITNTGTASLAVSSVKLGGADTGAFSLRADKCSGGRLSVGARCVAEVLFAPRRDGPHRAELSIRHDGGGGAKTLVLSGIGISPRLTAEPAEVDLGEVPVGDRVLGRVLLANRGRASLAVGRALVSGVHAADFVLIDDRCGGASLGPGERCRLEIELAPRAAGPRRAALRIETSAGLQPLEIPLLGSGAAPRPARLEVVPESVDFGDVYVGQRGEIVALEVHNPGRAPVALEGFVLEGLLASDFHLVPGSCDGASRIAAGGRCTVGVQLIPESAGELRAKLRVTHDGEGGVTTVPLRGHGQVPGVTN